MDLETRKKEDDGRRLDMLRLVRVVNGDGGEIIMLEDVEIRSICHIL